MGRTPHTPKIKEGVGRDHHVNGYSIFLAGGGFKPGFTYGTTDEFGNSVVEKSTSIHSIHATILHQLGLDHDKLTFRFGGRGHESHPTCTVRSSTSFWFRSLRGRNDRSEKVGNRGRIFSILRCIVVLFAEESGKYGPILPLSQ